MPVRRTVGDVKVNARIDSGAEITIISTKCFQKLKKAPPKMQDVNIQMADHESVLQGFIVQPVQMTIGKQVVKERVYVAPIADEMLLGHDLLHHLGALLDMQTDTLFINGERIPMTTHFLDGSPKVARVSIAK